MRMAREDLHPTQQELLRLLATNVSDPLSLRALQSEVGASSPSVIAHHLGQLEKKGYLKRNPNDPNQIQVQTLVLKKIEGGLVDRDQIYKIPDVPYRARTSLGFTLSTAVSNVVPTAVGIPSMP